MFNQTDKSPMIYLGENYDPGWEASIDGQPLNTHVEANSYANGWLTNTTAGTHEVEIRYKYDSAYQYLVYLSIILACGLAVASYFPARIIDNFSSRKKRSNASCMVRPETMSHIVTNSSTRAGAMNE